jgi:hypothetical protein
MKSLNFKNLMRSLAATALVAAAGLIMSCTKGGSLTGSSSSSSISGSLALTSIYPSSTGASWTPIKASNRYYIKGLAVTVVGTCTRGIVTIKANEGGSNYSETATCGIDGSFTWSKSYTAGSGEGDKTLNFQAYDSTDAAISGALFSQDVRIDNTAPAVPVVTNPASTPFTYNGATTLFDIQGNCAADVDHITGPANVTIACSGGTWTYSATLVEGASTAYAFSAWDLAGNQSAGFTQQINWVPTVIMYSAGVGSGGAPTDGGTSYSLEATVDANPGVQTDSFTSYSLKTGFNYIINTVRGL